MIHIFKIDGNSMEPEYKEGDFVLSLAPSFLRPKVNKDVIINHPIYGVMIKRVAEIKENSLLVKGLNPSSLSTEKMGKINFKDILGTKLFHFKAS